MCSLINNLFIPVHLIQYKLFKEQYSCIFSDQRVKSCGQTLQLYFQILINAS